MKTLVVISVIGDEYLEIDDNTKNNLKFSLMEIAKSHNALIITNGTNEGVDRFVTEAFKADLEAKDLEIIGIVSLKSISEMMNMKDDNMIEVINIYLHKCGVL